MAKKCLEYGKSVCIVGKIKVEPDKLTLPVLVIINLSVEFVEMTILPFESYCIPFTDIYV